MVESPRKGRAGALGVTSLVLAILAGAGSATGAVYPGGLVGLVAAVLGFIALRRAGGRGAARTVPALGITLGLLVLVAVVVLVVTDPSL